MSVSSPGAKVGDRTQDRDRWRGRKPSRLDLMAWIRQHRVKLIWATLLLAATGLFAWWIWLLRYAPVRTPVVVLSSAPYSWPLPPNAWASEDLDKLSVIDGESITLRGRDQSVRSKVDFLERLDREIRRGDSAKSSVPLMIWVSMHGVADANGGKVYLIPSRSDPTDPSTWVTFDELMARLDSLSPERQTLLVLDCNRMQLNWNIGLVANHFTERVRQAIDNRGRGNLAVLISAGPDQQAHVSADLQGSVFGHYFRQGLAGAADGSEASGNGDGWVSLSELSDFLQRRVGHWTLRNRGTRQSPVLLTSEEGLDFPLALALNPESLAEMLDIDSKVGRSAPTIPTQRLDRLWQKFDGLRQSHLYQQEPLAWRDLEHRLLWLEQLSESGTGYRSLAQRTLDSVEADMQGVVQRESLSRQSRSVSDHGNILIGDSWRLPSALRMHTLPLAEYFGTIDLGSSLAIARGLNKFAQEPSAEQLAGALSEIQGPANEGLESGRFLRMLERYGYQEMPWRSDESSDAPRGGDVQTLLGLQSRLRDLAVPRDLNGFPADQRVHGWTRKLVTSLDDARRADEDRLFAKSARPLVANDDIATSLETAARSSEKLQQSIRVCDQAMAQTTYLASWFTHPRRGVGADVVKDEVDNRLLPLIESTSELSRRLAAHSEASSDFDALIDSIDAIDRFGDSNVGQPLDGLSNQWNDVVGQLSNRSESNDPTVVGEIRAALSVPLVDATRRATLRRALKDLAVRLHQEYDPAAPEPSDVGGPQTVEESDDQTNGTELTGNSARIGQWTRHPLLAVLGIDRESVGVSQSPIGLMLNDVTTQIKTSADATTLVERRSTWALAASRIRAAAPVWFAKPALDPIGELRQIDLQSLLVWHAGRALDDFWGPAGQDQAFFDLAATDYLNGAKRLGGAAADEPRELADLSTRLAAGRRAAPSWINTRAMSEVQLDSTDSVQAQVVVSADNVAGFQPAAGVGTVMIQQDGTRLATPTFNQDTVNLRAADETVDVTLSANLVQTDGRLQAQTVFRGHEYPTTLPIEKLGGVRVEVDPHRYERSDVTLSSPWDQLSVAFVMDCSSSMNSPLNPAGEGGSRFDVAKLALQEMLFDLGLRNNVRTAVHLFGHRLGWSTDSPVRPLTRPDFIGEIGPDTTPSQDVESVLPLSNFDLATAQAVIPRVSRAKPWGQSPLYLATVQALQEFGEQDVTADRHVIVITDGANYQFIPSGESGVRATTDQDVLAAWAQQQVPVHILGIDMDRTEDRQTMEDFRRICRETGGQFQDLAATDLRQALNRLLAPGIYRLGNVNSDAVPEYEETLGRGVRLPAPEASDRYWLTFEGRSTVIDGVETPGQLAAEELQLEGGESLQLFVSPSGDVIHAYPFDENVAAQSDLVTQQGASTEHVARVHQPERDSRGHVTFPISWQREDDRADSVEPRWRVTDRPNDVWVEIQPLASGDEIAQPPYVFFDANYEPDRPVPVVNFVARDWPENSNSARVRLWCQPPDALGVGLLPPAIGEEGRDTSESLATAIAVNEALASPIPVEIVAGVTVRFEERTGFVDPDAADQDADDQGWTRLRFVLDFSEANQPVDLLKVAFPPHSAATPRHIVRQFDPKKRIAVHSFFFDPRDGDLPDVIEVSHRRREQEGAWRFSTTSLDVDILEPGMFSPVSRKN